jgi:tetratricopeptide (TPR) repeat protein
MDDLHWADPASIEALTDLLALVTDRPMLFILALRPDWNSPGWQMFVNTQLEYPDQCLTVFLEPLTREDSRALITALLGPTIPGRVVDAIQQKAEGNPLFIEEVARALLESGVVTHTEAGPAWRSDGRDEEVLRLISLPGNVQALMTARIDRLAPDVRRTLQLAAVIGRTFPQRVLQQLAGPGVDVADQLQTLIGADLVRPTGSGDEHTFLHALARDAAYETILLRQRRRTHRQVAEVIEAAYPDRLEEEASRLAYHYAEARDWPRAIHCYGVAGRTAAKIFAHAEAVEHFSRAIELALGAPTAVDDAALIDLFLRRGRICELEGQYDDALATYVALEELGRTRRNPRLELAGLTPQAILFGSPNPLRDAVRGRERAERVLALARQHGDPEAEARAYWALLLINVNSEINLPQAITYGEQALALARAHNLREVQAHVLNDLGRVYSLSGRLSDGIDVVREARDLWQELGNEPMLADALGLLAYGLLFDGQPAESVASARHCLAIAHRIGNGWGEAFGSMALGQGLLHLGRFDEAFDAFRQSADKALEIGFVGPGAVIPIFMAWTYRQLGAPGTERERLAAWLAASASFEGYDVLHHHWRKIEHLNAGRPDLALALVNDGTPSIMTSGNDFMFGSLVDPAVLLANGQYEATLAAAEDSLARMRASSHMPFATDHLRYRALAYRGLGDDAAARAALAEAYEQAKACNNRRILWQILLDRVAMAPDEATRAACRAEALAEINDLAANLDDPTLYAAFLAQPPVRALLGPA